MQTEILKEINFKCPRCKIKIKQYYHYSISDKNYYSVDKFKCDCDWCISRFNREIIYMELSKKVKK